MAAYALTVFGLFFLLTAGFAPAAAFADEVDQPSQQPDQFSAIPQEAAGESLASPHEEGVALAILAGEANPATIVDGEAAGSAGKADAAITAEGGAGEPADEESVDKISADVEPHDTDAPDASGEDAQEGSATVVQNPSDEKTPADKDQQSAVDPNYVGWVSAEDGYHYYKKGVQVENDWVVTQVLPGDTKATEYQRYYLGESGVLLVDQTFCAEQSGIASWFYATPDGSLARGAYRVGDLVYCADNDGRLLITEGDGGWVVTDFVTGSFQRYYIYNDVHAARVGFSLDGWAHYTTEQGCALIGAYAVDDLVYLGNSDGLLAGGDADGWLVSDAYGQGLQRYWVYGDLYATKAGVIFVEGAYYYTLPTVGYVLRGSAMAEDRLVWADNDGKLAISFGVDMKTEDGKNSTLVSSQSVSGSLYLFLPSYTDLSDLTLNLDWFDFEGAVYVSDQRGGEYVKMSTGDVLDLTSLGNLVYRNYAYHLYYKNFADSDSIYELNIMVSSAVSTVYITSADAQDGGRAAVEASKDHSLSCAATVVVVAADGSLIYDKDTDSKQSKVKGRGNSTWRQEKRPYQIKLSKSASLIDGTEENSSKTWVLLANYLDGSLMHNYVGLKLTASLSDGAAVDCTFVDLYYDGEYRGTYLLAEKVEVSDSRVDIDDLEDYNITVDGKDPETHATATAVNGYGNTFQYVTGMISAEDYSGGYLVERDNYAYDEVCWFETSIGVFTVKSPEYASEEEMRYISEYVQRAIDCGSMTSGNLSQYMDLQTLAANFLVQIFAKNPDYITHSSTYFYKDKGDDIIYSGPVWDLDLGFGIHGKGTETTDEWWCWYESFFFDNKEFRQAVRDLFNSEFKPMLEELLAGDSCAFLNQVGTLQASARMNSVLWGTINQAEGYELIDPAFANNTYEEDALYMLKWMRERYAWMDAQINSSSWL